MRLMTHSKHLMTSTLPWFYQRFPISRDSLYIIFSFLHLLSYTFTCSPFLFALSLFCLLRDSSIFNFSCWAKSRLAAAKRERKIYLVLLIFSSAHEILEMENFFLSLSQFSVCPLTSARKMNIFVFSHTRYKFTFCSRMNLTLEMAVDNWY